MKHETVSESFDFLRVRNIDLTPEGFTFGEVMPHFIIGGDEIGFQANGAEVKIVGDAHRRKHEKDTASSRVTISVYRTGSTAGSTGPSVILPPGVRKVTGWTDAFLVAHGAAPGSTIVMTDSGYMTEEAWRECAPSVIAGIRNMPVINFTHGGGMDDNSPRDRRRSHCRDRHRPGASVIPTPPNRKGWEAPI